MNREKRTYSGKLLDVDFYPVFSDGRRIPSKAPKTKRSTEEQEKYNHNKAVREFVRKANANFSRIKNPQRVFRLCAVRREKVRNPKGRPGFQCRRHARFKRNRRSGKRDRNNSLSKQQRNMISTNGATKKTGSKNNRSGKSDLKRNAVNPWL